MKSSRNRKKGMTLVEIIIALAIIGIMAISFLTIFTSSFSTIFSMGRRTKAMNDEAQMYMDQIYNGTAVASIDSLPNVDVFESSDSSGLRLITVTVTYSQNQSVKLTGLVP
ncbi:MAG: prepilin-type N-terminal cleavage/methylation domain-containing protein [Clostridiales bacterium]|nr:prepilin-type N-terminal cleavage/methylation domain-containing protein [Clostridiales bacterium]